MAARASCACALLIFARRTKGAVVTFGHMNNTFSIQEALSFAWDLFTKRAWFFIGLAIILAAVSMVIGTIGAIPLLGFLVSLAGGTYIGMGVIQGTLRAQDNTEALEYKDFWAPHPFWKFLLASLLVGVVVALPIILVTVVFGSALVLTYAMAPSAAGALSVLLILALVSGLSALIWAVMAGVYLMFVKFLVMDRAEIGIVEALKESKRLVTGNWWKVLGASLLMGLLNFVGALLLLVGLLVTIPVSMLFIAHIYRELAHDAHEIAEVEDVAPSAVVDATDTPGTQI